MNLIVLAFVCFFFFDPAREREDFALAIMMYLYQPAGIGFQHEIGES
jgi:hypothetical protein